MNAGYLSKNRSIWVVAELGASFPSLFEGSSEIAQIGRSGLNLESESYSEYWYNQRDLLWEEANNWIAKRIAELQFDPNDVLACLDIGLLTDGAIQSPAATMKVVHEFLGDYDFREDKNGINRFIIRNPNMPDDVLLEIAQAFILEEWGDELSQLLTHANLSNQSREKITNEITERNLEYLLDEDSYE